MAQLTCPACDSPDIELKNDTFRLYYCYECHTHFSEEDIRDLRAACRRKPRSYDDDWDDFDE